MSALGEEDLAIDLLGSGDSGVNGSNEATAHQRRVPCTLRSLRAVAAIHACVTRQLTRPRADPSPRDWGPCSVHMDLLRALPIRRNQFPTLRSADAVQSNCLRCHFCRRGKAVLEWTHEGYGL